MNRTIILIYALAMSTAILATAARAITRGAWPAEPARPFRLVAQPEVSTEVQSNYRGSVAHAGSDRLAHVPARLNAAWSVPGLNVGVLLAPATEPAVDASGVYVGADTGWFQKLGRGGEVEWSYLDQSADHGFAGAPALDARHAFVVSTSGNVVSLAKSTGRPEWMLRLAGEILAPPTLHEDSLFVTLNAHGGAVVLRLGRADGRVRWTSAPLGGRSFSSPAIDPSLGLLFVGAGDRRVTALALDSGRLAWTRELDAEIQTSATLAGRSVHVVTRGGFVYAIDAAQGEVTWKTFVDGGSRTPPTFEPSQDSILAGTEKGMLYALDRRSGQPRWADRTGTLFSGLAGALAVSQPGREGWLVWVTCADLVVCGLNPKTGKIVTQLPLRGPSAGSPVAFGGALFVTEAPGGITKYE